MLSTGSELVPPGEPLADGQIPDSNHVLVAGMVREAGALPVLLGAVPDDAAALRARLAQNLGRVDAVVTTGGVSAGAYDVVKEVLAPLGEVTFEQVAMQPGKPQGFGVLRGTADGRALATPPPAPPGPACRSSACPATRSASSSASRSSSSRRCSACAGWWAADGPSPRPSPPPAGAARPAGASTCRSWSTAPTAKRRTGAAATVRVRPATAGGSGSHLVASLARADALAVVDAEVDAVREGDVVRVMMVP